MKKLFKSKAFTVVRSILLGTFATPIKPLMGAVSGLAVGIKQVKEDNLNSKLGGEGKVDWARVVGYVIFIGLVYLLVTGKIDQETFNDLLKSFTKLD